MTDRELLLSYAREGSQDAFAELVKRHTPVVYGSCRRILGDAHAAEDALQAAFIVLMRKAGSLRDNVILADWLFRTARNCALNLKRGMRRQARREQEASMAQESALKTDVSWQDVRPVLDNALAVLPARQRQAAVLHYYYGLSQSEIARQTKSPVTTVARRISSALEKLRNKLSGKGLNLSAVALVGFLQENLIVSAPAGLAASVSSACINAATTSTTATSIANGVIAAIKAGQLKIAAWVLSSAVLLTGGAGYVYLHFARGPLARAVKDQPAVLKTINNLQAGYALRLAPARVLLDPSHDNGDSGTRHFASGPGYRYKCNRMPFVPERGSGLYCGAASMFTTNDVWEYFPGANTWLQISPASGGDHRQIALAAGRIKAGRDVKANRQLITDWYANQLKAVDNNICTTGNGGPVFPSHTWDGIRYAPQAGKLFWVLTGAIRGPINRELLSQTNPDLSHTSIRGSFFWSLDVASGNWRPEKSAGPAPRMHGMGGSLIYDSRRKRMIWYVAASNVMPYDHQMWSYDLASGSWKDLAPNNGTDLKILVGKGQAPDGEIQAVYHAELDIVVAVSGQKCWTYNCTGNSWEASAGSSLNRASAQHTVFVVESVSGRFLLVDTEKGIINSFNSRSNSWQELGVKGESLPGKRSAGFFDSRLGVLVLYDGGDRLWVYRPEK
jgi:RNA polymerase sigma factor (sigma-70 family)